MRRRLTTIVLVTFALAGLLSLLAASLAATVVERNAQSQVSAALLRADLPWAETYAEGLQVFIAGTAPSEAARFVALSTAGSMVDAARVIDNIQVEATAELAPPRFSVELLRNDAGISVIGLIPEASDRQALVSRLQNMIEEPETLSDLLQTAAYPEPDGWESAIRYALTALAKLPKAKISVSADQITITATAESTEARDRLETDLRQSLPADLPLTLALTAPRPVITPFTLRFVMGPQGARFDACSADTPNTQAQILAAAMAAGLEGEGYCPIGLGVPSPRWGDAVVTLIEGLQELGGGTLTLSDADAALTALEGTDPARFDQITARLEKSLPEVFSLRSTLPQPAGADSITQEFTATRSPEGLLQMRGRLRNALSRDTIESYAQARFGSENTYMAARLSDTLPENWPTRVMAGLDALAGLHAGSLSVTPDVVAVSGRTGSEATSARLSALLADRLGEANHFTLDVRYEESLDPLARIPTPEECIARLQAVQAERKISFEPGSDLINQDADDLIDAIEAILRDCGPLQLEIQGHTDSQGRESMNKQLSQARAQAVLTALQERRLLTGTFRANGYGESQPIADNDTPEGREANRRIEFVLMSPLRLHGEHSEDDGHAHEGDNEDTTGATESSAQQEAEESPANDQN